MTDYDVRAIDDDNSHLDDFSSTDLGWFTPSYFAGLPYQFYLKHLNTSESAEIGATGSVSGVGNT